MIRTASCVGFRLGKKAADYICFAWGRTCSPSTGLKDSGRNRSRHATTPGGNFSGDHKHCCLLPGTLFLAINLLDRYCSVKMVRKSRYTPFGYVELLVAAKSRDTSREVPSPLKFCEVFASPYTVKELASQEWHLLSTPD